MLMRQQGVEYGLSPDMRDIGVWHYTGLCGLCMILSEVILYVPKTKEKRHACEYGQTKVPKFRPATDGRIR